MDFAYLDEYKIMHIVDKKETAQQFATSKIVETSLPNGGEYPTADGKHVIVYTSDKKYKINGVEYPLADLKKSYPSIAALVAELV